MENSMTKEDIILSFDNISKSFPGVKALSDVSFQVRRCDIHALVGENGAGKSTLINILCGVYPHGTYDGNIIYDGVLRKFTHISDVMEAGIACVHQEMSLCQNLSISENIYLGRYLVTKGIVNFDQMYFKTNEILKQFGLNSNGNQVMNPNNLVRTLGVGMQQVIEIARCLAFNVKLLILDEPTAALSEVEVKKLFEILLNLKHTGVTCIYISHRLDEVFQVADTITVLRDGLSMDTRPKSKFTRDEVVKLMVGRELKTFYPREKHIKGNIIFDVRNFSIYHPSINSKKIVDNVCLKAFSGEILGIYGLMGSGRTELFSGIFGAYPGRTEGEIRLEDKLVDTSNPQKSIKLGIFLVTEDRKKFGLNLNLSVRENATLASLKIFSQLNIINEHMEHIETNKMIRLLSIKTPHPESKINTLSGGNQQKVIIARSLLNRPKIIILDEPTRGIDIGAKFEIYTIMNKLVSQGVGIIMISSEIDEIIGMSDRILTFCNGKVSTEFNISDATPERLMHAATAFST